MYARTERKNKLEWRVDKVRWMGIDDKSENAYCVYWPSKRIITVERNVQYWKPTQHNIEGEEERTYLSDATLAYVHDPQPSATIAKLGLLMPQPQATGTPHIPIPDPITAPCPKRTCQPSQRMLDIINGKALDPTPP